LPDGENPGLSGVRAVLVVPARMTRSGLLAYPRQNLSRPGADAPRHASTASASPGSPGSPGSSRPVTRNRTTRAD